MFWTKLCLAAVIVTIAAACGSSDDGAEASIAIKSFAFTPSELVVTSGATVEWTNQDDVRHTVMSGRTSGSENVRNGLFAGELGQKDATFSFTFEEPGTHTYFCSQHNVMTGTVRVQRGGTA